MARLCACPEISSESNSVQTLQKSFGWDYKPRSPVCIRMQKDHKHMCGKQQNNPACTKMCQSSQCWSWTLYKRRRRTMLTHWSQFVPNMSSRPVWVGRMRRKRTTGQHAEEKMGFHVSSIFILQNECHCDHADNISWTHPPRAPTCSSSIARPLC